MSRSLFFIGVDPGYTGAIAVITEIDKEVDAVSFCNLSMTLHDQINFLSYYAVDSCALLEKVGSMPKQGVASSFKFGTSYGKCEGILAASTIPYKTIAPGKWQRAMRCLSGGDKNVTKAAAQRLFPSEKLTHARADALLLAELCRTHWQTI